MKPYSEYSAEELAMENLFIRWVRFPNDPPIRSFWENWMLKYPNKEETVNQARELVLVTCNRKMETLSNQEVNSIWDRIMTSLEIVKDREPGDSAAKIVDTTLKPKNIIWGVLLAGFLSLLGIIFLFYVS